MVMHKSRVWNFSNLIIEVRLDFVVRFSSLRKLAWASFPGVKV